MELQCSIYELNQLNSHTTRVYSVCFLPDGATLASGSVDNSIRLWDVKTGQQKAKSDDHANWVQSICFSPDGTTLGSSIRYYEQDII
ncbi:unnamed protein product [Paramecium sonneborni]|uniref:Uncharacterized protein n=1 Tax=Paramecium sonneborni TaxID=65129 RepID=A0A8S1RUW4_9CILI|nr:unnamed protein product [Paramecium sonneborni]